MRHARAGGLPVAPGQAGGIGGSELERRPLHVDAVVAYALGRALLHAGQVLQTGERLFAAQVEHDGVGELRAAAGAPEGGFLQVEYLVGRLVARLHVLVVAVGHRPRLAAQALPVGVEHVPLGDAGILAVVVRVERLDADVASRRGGVELHFLPSVAGLELAAVARFFAREVKLLPRLAVGGGRTLAQFVDDGGRESLDGCFAGADDVHHDDFVLALAEPAAGHVERLLRAYLPEAADGVPVDVYLALAPCLHVDERVARLAEVERGAVASRHLLSVGGAVCHVALCLVAVGQTVDAPVFQVDVHLASVVHGVGEFDAFGDALEVLDGASEVDASHGLDEYVETVASPQGGQQEGLLVVAAVERSDEPPVDEDLREVVGLGHGEHALRGHLGRLCAVEDGAPSLSELFHGAYVHRLHRLGQVVEERCHVGEFHARQADDGILGGYGGERPSAVAVGGHHLAQLGVLGRHLSGLVDGRVIVVRRHVGREPGAVGSGPVAPVGAAVGHVEGEGDVFVEHLAQSVDHLPAAARLVASAPFVEPSAPEFGAHLGRLGAQFAQAAELVVDVGARAEVHRPHEVVEPVLGEVGAPVALEERHLVEARVADDVAHFADVGFVLAVGAVFILHLHHDDGSALLDGEPAYLFAHLLFEDAQSLHEVGVALAQAYVFFLQQPPGQSAHLPLGADVGSGAHDDVHAVFLRQADEGREVVVAREIELSLLLLVYVPEDVDAECVHAQRLAHLDALLPVGSRDAGVVYFGGLDDEGLAVEQECLVAHGEGAAAGGGRRGRGGRESGRERQRCQRPADACW